AIWIARAQYPRLRAQHLAFRYLVPIGQKALGMKRQAPGSPLAGFASEDPAALTTLRMTYGLDAVVATGRNDFERWILLMHWARDRFPHLPSRDAPDAQAFDAAALL